MREWLYRWDLHFFRLINVDLSNYFFDLVIPFLRMPLFWLPFYVFLLVFITINYKKAGWVVSFFCGICVAIADVTSSRIVKPFFGRIRPCNDPLLSDWIHSRVPCGSGLSFTSSHATNHMAVALFIVLVLGKRFPWCRIPLICWALLVGFAQIYVGVHYPVDVMGGFILGAAIAIVIFLVYRKLPQSLLLEWIRKE
ncbi:MAG: phosphatase PAP2 family protein [Saprospiraceae bacterium]